MADFNTKGKVWRAPLVGAVILGVLDLVIWGILFGVPLATDSPPSAALSTWVLLHEPALSIGTAILPGPQSAHSPVPQTTLVFLAVLFVAQAAILGAALGWVFGLLGRRRHAL
jgi:hypothetical protein